MWEDENVGLEVWRLGLAMRVQGLGINMVQSLTFRKGGCVHLGMYARLLFFHVPTAYFETLHPKPQSQTVLGAHNSKPSSPGPPKKS